MIDGVPIGNPAGTDGSLDFGNLSAVDIDRIEIVRGPQSSLYGSDAMSGVINIITKKGKKGEPRRTVTIEGGSYGTRQATATLSGSADSWIYSLGVTDMYTAGFPTYGYRVNRPLYLSDGVTPLPPLPSDQPSDKGGANANFTYTIGAGRERRFRVQRVRKHLAARQSRRIPAIRRLHALQHLDDLDRRRVHSRQRHHRHLTNHLTVFANTTTIPTA